MLAFACAMAGASREEEAARARAKLHRNSTSSEAAGLRALGEYYGTDKATSGFVDVYSEALPHGEDRTSVHHLLEIGVFFGASIKMWRDYYPSATIIGIDAFKGIEGYKVNGHNPGLIPVCRHPSRAIAHTV
jgi:hypothetical protein|eukprot:2166170-Prymnesium_polylepis.1